MFAFRDGERDANGITTDDAEIGAAHLSEALTAMIDIRDMLRGFLGGVADAAAKK